MKLSKEEEVRLRNRLTSLIFEVIVQLVEWRQLERLLTGKTHDLANSITHAVVQKLISDVPRLKRFYQVGGHGIISLENSVFEEVASVIEDVVLSTDYKGHRRIMAREFASVIMNKLEYHPMITNVLGLDNPRRNTTGY